jgi:bacillolysin
VSMKYNGAPSQCETFQYGEVEDYTVHIKEAATCAVPGSLAASNITETSATLSWGAVSGAASYDVRIKATNATTWSTFNRTTTSLGITGLQAGTAYEFQVRTNCSGSSSTYSASTTFTTAAPAVSYCASKGNNATQEWIARVRLASIDNTTASNGGYADFTNLSTDLKPGTSYTVFVTPGFAGSSYREYWKVWIDYNGNGSFDDAGELVLNRNASNTNTQSATFTVPAGAKLGKTRMRVSMKYNATQTSCETFAYGEVEDYSINITNSTTSALAALTEATTSFEAPLSQLTIFPNPARDAAFIEASLAEHDGATSLQVFDLQGKVIYSKDLGTGVSQVSERIDLSAHPSGMYHVKIISGNNSISKKLVLIR